MQSIQQRAVTFGICLKYKYSIKVMFICGYLSGVRCRLFAYGPADANASQNPIISCLT